MKANLGPHFSVILLYIFLSRILLNVHLCLLFQEFITVHCVVTDTVRSVSPAFTGVLSTIGIETLKGKLTKTVIYSTYTSPLIVLIPRKPSMDIHSHGIRPFLKQKERLITHPTI